MDYKAKEAYFLDWGYVSEYSPTDKHPMVVVSWDEAAAYCE